jgi:hypothetical protein
MLGRERSTSISILLHEAEGETKWFGREKAKVAFPSSASAEIVNRVLYVIF